MKEFSHSIRVYYEDTDAIGVLYHANHIKFLERARTEWLRALGFEQDQLSTDHNILFVVSRLEVEFKAPPARFNQLLRVTVALETVRRVTLELRQRILIAEGESLCCDARVRIACVSADRLRPTPLPRAVAAALEATQGGAD